MLSVPSRVPDLRNFGAVVLPFPVSGRVLCPNEAVFAKKTCIHFTRNYGLVRATWTGRTAVGTVSALS